MTHGTLFSPRLIAAPNSAKVFVPTPPFAMRSVITQPSLPFGMSIDSGPSDEPPASPVHTIASPTHGPTDSPSRSQLEKLAIKYQSSDADLSARPEPTRVVTSHTKGIPTTSQLLPLSACIDETDADIPTIVLPGTMVTDTGDTPLLPSQTASPETALSPTEATPPKSVISSATLVEVDLEAKSSTATGTPPPPPPPSASRVEQCFTAIRRFPQQIQNIDPFSCCSARCKQICAKIWKQVQKVLPVASFVSMVWFSVTNNSELNNVPWMSLSAIILGSSIQSLLDKYASKKLKQIFNSLEKHNGSEIILYTLAIILFPNLETTLFYTYMSMRAGMMYVQTFLRKEERQATELEANEDDNRPLTWQDFFNQRFLLHVAKCSAISIASFLVGAYAIGSNVGLGMPALFFRWLGTASASTILGTVLHKVWPRNKFLQQAFSALHYFSVNPGSAWSYTLRTILFGAVFGYNNSNLNADLKQQHQKIAAQIPLIKRLSPQLLQNLKHKLAEFQQSRAYRMCWRNAGKKLYYGILSVGGAIVAAAPWVMSGNDPILLANELPIYLVPITFLLARLAYISPVLDQLKAASKQSLSLAHRTVNYLLNKNVMIFGSLYCLMLRANFYLTYQGYKSNSIERGTVLSFVYGIFFILLGMQYAALKYRQPFLNADLLERLAQTINAAEAQNITFTEAEAEFILDIIKYHWPEALTTPAAVELASINPQQASRTVPAAATSAAVELASVQVDTQQTSEAKREAPPVGHTAIIKKNPPILTAAALAIAGIFRSSTPYRAATTPFSQFTAGFTDSSQGCSGNNLLTCGQVGRG